MAPFSERLDAFHQTLREGVAFTAWSAIPAPRVAHSLAGAGFDAVTLDLQHGYHTEDTAFSGLDAALLGGAIPGLRIPVGRYDLASRALDAGAAFVIAPMVNSAAEAKLFADAMKFPPIGERSWSPLRAMDAYEGDKMRYLAEANLRTLSLAMIETPAAIDAVDAILAEPGIDGVFVGPSDLSITLSGGAMVAPEDKGVDDAIDYILDRALSAGKLPAIYATTPARAASFRARGFRFIAVSMDEQFVRAGAAKALAEAKGTA
ncbi:MAG: 2,4-dihydroxyhept-2-ene-1,7-dioic acid aldolase [Hyphomicrobiaceae bacterium]|nr:2,4-dihydroxyhept-2-ene-1,7-dioic acid aldolase [Hyphomicrobiaceae bacterium]